MNTPEHWDRLGRTFLNMEHPLKSLRAAVPVITNQRAAAGGVKTSKMIAECFPVSASAKQVQVDINSGHGIRTIYLFKEVVREI